MDHSRHRLCVALDGSDREWIISTAATLAPHVGWLKLGLEAFTAFGPELVTEVADLGARVFLDLKLHDIPNTVRRAAANCAATGAAMFNVHASGGRAMLESAREGAMEGSTARAPKVLAVTVLTSLDRRAVDELGFGRSPDELVVSWARLAKDVGSGRCGGVGARGPGRASRVRTRLSHRDPRDPPEVECDRRSAASHDARRSRRRRRGHSCRRTPHHRRRVPRVGRAPNPRRARLREGPLRRSVVRGGCPGAGATHNPANEST